MDGLAAVLAAPFLKEKQMNEMEFYIQSIDLAIKTNNFSMYHKMQESFHGVYLSLCPNKSLVNLLLQLEKKFVKTFDHAEQTELIKKRLLQTNNEHRTMVELFKNNDLAELERFMKEVHWNSEKAELLPL